MKWLPEEAHLEVRLRLPQQENEEKRKPQVAVLLVWIMYVPGWCLRLTVFVHTGLVVFSRSLSYGV